MIESNEYTTKLWDAIVAKSLLLDRKYKMSSDYHSGSIFFYNLIDGEALYATVGWEYPHQFIYPNDVITIPIAIDDGEGNYEEIDELSFIVTLDIDKDVDKYFEILLPYFKTKGY